MNFVKDLVSVLTPCYNTEKYIGRLLESVLKQTYPKIEMVVIDDGSTDNSAEIIKGYISQFEQRGYSLRYVWQENSGQSVAIREGLKMISGEYLVWPDSDDYYSSDEAITAMVEMFKSQPESVGMVRTMGQLIKEGEDFEVVGLFGKNAPQKEGRIKLFEDCLFARNGFYFVPGEYMVRTEYLLKSIKGEIYTEKSAGQNWQLMLPVLYNYDCVTIPRVLYNITVRGSSHSRGTFNRYESIIRNYSFYERTIIATLKNIKNLPEEAQNKYIKDIKLQYLRGKFKASCNHGMNKEAAQFYKSLKENRNIFFSDKIRFVAGKTGLLSTIIRFKKLMK